MKFICQVIFFGALVVSVACSAQDMRQRISNDRRECVFRYQEPLIASYEEKKILFGDGENVIDIPAKRVGGQDAWVSLPKCDQKKWHCLGGFAAPLFIPKPFDHRLMSWDHADLHYEFGEEFTLESRGGMKVRPLLIHARGENGIDKLRSVYFFDKQMNLIGYSRDSARMESGAFMLSAAWLVTEKAPLDCY